MRKPWAALGTGYHDNIDTFPKCAWQEYFKY